MTNFVQNSVSIQVTKIRTGDWFPWKTIGKTILTFVKDFCIKNKG